MKVGRMDTLQIENCLRRKFDTILSILDERQIRLLLAVEAREIGYGGVSVVARASGYSRETIYSGLEDLKGPLERGSVRERGGGRKTAVENQPELAAALNALVDKDSRGDPMSPLRWTTKSTRRLSEALKEQGFDASYGTVGKLLHQQGFSLQSNVKTREGSSHADRNLQFEYITSQVLSHQIEGAPVISVDTKKKELVGDFKNGGREYQLRGEPVETQVHDFLSSAEGKAIPYGVYDVTLNSGWVNVGMDHDTSAFAVESIRRWWTNMGSKSYQGATKLLICADGGGSNGSRVRLWKRELAALSKELGLTITVCHFPPGTSKWNKIEHRLFSHIAMNWRGRPLISYEVIVDLIGATTTKQGLRVQAALDRSSYPISIVVSDDEMAGISFNRHAFHGEWNYTFPSP